jgi:hypothetical protein
VPVSDLLDQLRLRHHLRHVVLSRFSIEHYSRDSNQDIQDQPDLHSFVSILRLGRLLLHPRKRIGRVIRPSESGPPGPCVPGFFEPIGPRKRNPES